MNFKRGFGRILDTLIGLVGAVVWIWQGFFGPPDEPEKQEWHWQ